MPDLSLRQITFHSDLVSKPVRDNFTDTENAINNLQDQIDALATPPAGTEVTNARDYHTVLRDRLRSDSLGRGNVLVSGGVVTAQGSPNMTVAISAGEAVIGGIAVKWSGQNSGTITAPATGRYDVVVINSDSTISILSGNDSADKVLPDVASTQKAVAVITLSSATTSITNSLIRDCSEQGVHANGHYFWKIQDAVDSLNDRTNELDEGEIVVHKGNYYEEVVLSAFSNVTIRYENGSKHYRPSATKRCIKSINTAGNEESFIKIIGGKFYGNSKSGAIENLRFEYTDYLSINNCFSDGNASASATYKDLFIKQCDHVETRSQIDDMGLDTCTRVDSSDLTWCVDLYGNVGSTSAGSPFIFPSYIDPYSAYNSGTGVITIPADGRYIVSSSVQTSADDTLYVSINGAAYSNYYHIANHINAQNSRISKGTLHLTLSAGDTVALAGNTTDTIISSYNGFSITKV